MKLLHTKCIRFYKSILVFSFLFFACLFIVDAQQKDIAWYTANAPFKMPTVPLPTFADRSFSILDFGAVSDGQTLNTDAFRKTIEACAKAGGGIVDVPAGLWLTGPIELKSNINLHVERGALILFTKDHSQYPIIKASNTSTNFVTESPIHGYGLKNIAITGEGIIDGGGDSWRPVKKGKATDAQWKGLLASGGAVSSDSSVWWPNKDAMNGESIIKQIKEKSAKLTADDYIPAREYMRPYMLYLVDCDTVLIQGITLRNSPKFVFYPNLCTNLTMDHATVFNEWSAQNGDGIDISVCKNVVVYKCNVSVGDDGICMKSSGSKNDDPNVADLQNILIAGCNVYHAHGGFVIGSNTDGGVKNVSVSDCNFVGTDVGIRIKSNKGRGGLITNIFMQNIYMSDIATEAIVFDTHYEDLPAGKMANANKPLPDDKIPEFNGLHFNNIYCHGAKTAISITGLPEMPAHNLSFNNIIISADKGVVVTDASDIDMKAIKIITPESTIYKLHNVKNFNVTKGYYPATANVFIKADDKSSGIKVVDTDLRNDKHALQWAGDAK